MYVGWEPSEWYNYLDVAKSGSTQRAYSLAMNGWRKAARKVASLEDKLEEAEIHLLQIWKYYNDPRDYLVGRRQDPNLLVGWLKNRRSLEFKPRICDGKSPKYPGVLIDSGELWDFDDGSMVSPRREQFMSAVNKEKMRKFGMEDLKYVAQWV